MAKAIERIVSRNPERNPLLLNTLLDMHQVKLAGTPEEEESQRNELFFLFHGRKLTATDPSRLRIDCWVG
eukprot:scaffold421334_cov62-Attheya_sp.AAC.6